VTHVYVLDAWDDLTFKATTRVFSSQEDAERAKERFLADPRSTRRYAEVVKRKVR
jgi:hypothetical protein